MAHTSDGFENEGIAVVGMGGSVYTMKSAWIPAAAARMSSGTFPNMIAVPNAVSERTREWTLQGDDD